MKSKILLGGLAVLTIFLVVLPKAPKDKSEKLVDTIEESTEDLEETVENLNEVGEMVTELREENNRSESSR